jgi:DNA-binding response OmpR family regulator
MRRVPPPVAPADHGPIVLLAEDDDELRRLLARKLRRCGCDVIEARTGVQLVELAVEHTVEPLAPGERGASLVISDVRMPGHTGLEVLCLLRRADVTIPIILMTAFGDAETHAEAELLGATAIFDKPVDLDELAAMSCELVGLAHPGGA